MPKLLLAVNWNRKSAINFERKAIHKTNLPKTSKFQLKQLQKQVNHKSSKKPATSQKKQAQIHGENARLITLLEVNIGRFNCRVIVTQ